MQKDQITSVRPNSTNAVLCEVALRKRIEKNRDEIDSWLNGDYPRDLVYMRIRMLSAQNERLISKLKAG
jgi:stalled ribosome alternative rescue factor ArfA